MHRLCVDWNAFHSSEFPHRFNFEVHIRLIETKQLYLPSVPIALNCDSRMEKCIWIATLCHSTLQFNDNYNELKLYAMPRIFIVYNQHNYEIASGLKPFTISKYISAYFAAIHLYSISFYIFQALFHRFSLEFVFFLFGLADSEVYLCT